MSTEELPELKVRKSTSIQTFIVVFILHSYPVHTLTRCAGAKVIWSDLQTLSVPDCWSRPQENFEEDPTPEILRHIFNYNPFYHTN